VTPIASLASSPQPPSASNPDARADYILSLSRLQKKRFAASAVFPFAALTTTSADAPAISIAPATLSSWNSTSDASIARGAA